MPIYCQGANIINQLNRHCSSHSWNLNDKERKKILKVFLKYIELSVYMDKEFSSFSLFFLLMFLQRIFLYYIHRLFFLFIRCPPTSAFTSNRFVCILLSFSNIGNVRSVTERRENCTTIKANRKRTKKTNIKWKRMYEMIVAMGECLRLFHNFFSPSFFSFVVHGNSLYVCVWAVNTSNAFRCNTTWYRWCKQQT